MASIRTKKFWWWLPFAAIARALKWRVVFMWDQPEFPEVKWLLQVSKERKEKK